VIACNHVFILIITFHATVNTVPIQHFKRGLNQKKVDLFVGCLTKLFELYKLRRRIVEFLLMRS
jgi:hypothetical protein